MSQEGVRMSYPANMEDEEEGEEEEEEEDEEENSRMV